jgi:hypothetical protein
LPISVQRSRVTLLQFAGEDAALTVIGKNRVAQCDRTLADLEEDAVAFVVSPECAFDHHVVLFQSSQKPAHSLPTAGSLYLRVLKVEDLDSRDIPAVESCPSPRQLLYEVSTFSMRT